jgi:hypothetical protein
VKNSTAAFVRFIANGMANASSYPQICRVVEGGWSFDQRYQMLCHAQQEYLIDNFAFGDVLCIHISPIDKARWDIPWLAGAGRLYTVCK